VVSVESVERAGRGSRSRAIIFGLVALTFGLSSFLESKNFIIAPGGTGAASSRDLWILLAFIVALLIATGGALMTRRPVRQLMNDAVMKQNRSRGIGAGYAVAVAMTLAILMVPQLSSLSSAGAAFIIASSSLFTSIAVFAWLELRSMADVGTAE
jgi:hypothetical protein